MQKFLMYYKTRVTPGRYTETPVFGRVEVPVVAVLDLATRTGWALYENGGSRAACKVGKRKVWIKKTQRNATRPAHT